MIILGHHEMLTFVSFILSAVKKSFWTRALVSFKFSLNFDNSCDIRSSFSSNFKASSTSFVSATFLVSLALVKLAKSQRNTHKCLLAQSINYDKQHYDITVFL